MAGTEKQRNGSILPNILGGLGGIAGGVVNLIGQKQQQNYDWKSLQAQNKWNKEAAAQNYKWQQEAWERTNQFNSPEQVMARYKAAGLNPNLIYGGGVGNTAGTAPSQQAPHQDMRQRRPVLMSGVLSAYQDMELKKITIDNARKQGELLEKEKLIKGAEAAAASDYFSGRATNTWYKGGITKSQWSWLYGDEEKSGLAHAMDGTIPLWPNQNFNRMMNSQVDARYANIAATWRRILQMDADIDLKKKMLEYYDFGQMFKFASPAVGLIKGFFKGKAAAKGVSNTYKKIGNGVVDTQTGEYFR